MRILSEATCPLLLGGVTKNGEKLKAVYIGAATAGRGDESSSMGSPIAAKRKILRP